MSSSQPRNLKITLMKKLPITLLTNRQLDYAVAICEEQAPIYIKTDQAFKSRKSGIHLDDYPYSTNWSFSGPIIEREGINVCIQHDEHGRKVSPAYRWYAQLDCRVYTAYGPTPLIAAIRCYCCAKLGEFVDIPEELID